MTGPTPKLDIEALRSIEQATDGRARLYSWISVREWNREIEISYFLRVHVKGNAIFMELHGVIMPPPSSELRFVDTIPQRTTGNVIADLLLGIFVGGLYLVWSPLFLLGKFQEGMGTIFKTKEERTREAVADQIKNNPMYDFGAPLNLRRRAIGDSYGHYFQLIDRRLYEQSIRGAIIRGFIDYLDDCGIDTSELREQRNTILNQGIIVQSGNLNAQNVAVGEGAKVSDSSTK